MVELFICDVGRGFSREEELVAEGSERHVRLLRQEEGVGGARALQDAATARPEAGDGAKERRLAAPRGAHHQERLARRQL